MRRTLDRDGFAAARASAERFAVQRSRTGLRPSSTALIVNRVASLSPTRLNCLPRALTLWSLTKAEGYETSLKIGVAPRAAGGAPLEAHAWVELDGCALGETTARYVVLPFDPAIGGDPQTLFRTAVVR